MPLVDAHGKRIQGARPILKELGTAGWREQYPSYPSSGLTPERLTSIFREADGGDITRQSELFEEMEEKDSHLGAVLQSRKLAVAGLPWAVTPAGPSEQDALSAIFIKDALSRADGFEDAILCLMDAVGKGFAVTELIWRIENDRVLLEGLKPVSQKRFTFYSGDGISPEPRLITQASPVQGEPLAAMKFAVHHYKGRSAIAPRAGILRPCAWMYLFKNYTLKDWLIFNERYAMPMRIGKFGPGASETDRKVLRNAVFNLGADAAAVISEGTVIELLESAGKGGSADLYERMAGYCDCAISKSVLGQTLTTDQTGGTYATARVHQSVREDIILADARALERTIATQIIRPLIEFNFGPGTGLPAFRFRVSKEEDLKTLAETYSTLTSMGIAIPDTHIRERFGIPKPQEGAL